LLCARRERRGHRAAEKRDEVAAFIKKTIGHDTTHRALARQGLNLSPFSYPTTPAPVGNSFDHLVGDSEQPWREAEAECLGGVEVDHELELGRLADAHTHPGADVGQSPIDQRHPMVPIVGHTAMIVPNFANMGWWSLDAVG